MSAIDQVVSESTSRVVKNHPYIAIFTIAVSSFCSVMVGFWATNTFAEKEDMQSQIHGVKGEVQEVKGQVDKLTSTLNGFIRDDQKQKLEDAIRVLDNDIYQLESIVNSGQGTERDRHRLIEKRRELKEKENELRRLLYGND